MRSSNSGLDWDIIIINSYYCGVFKAVILGGQFGNEKVFAHGGLSVYQNIIQ